MFCLARLAPVGPVASATSSFASVRSMALHGRGNRLRSRPCSTQVQSLAVTVTKAVTKASAADMKCGLSRAPDTVRRCRFRLTIGD